MSSGAATKASFAASGTAQGVIGNGVAYFLLIYYSQVLGLDPALAGLAMMLSLVVDAVSDPLVGRWSDRLRHRLGRRHPFLFASIVPVAVVYYFLWAPPQLSQMGLFFYLLALAVSLRLALTIHVVPFNALLPEVTPDYDERTRLMNYSYSASWFLGTVMAVAMYAYWLADAPGEAIGSGILRSAGYVEAGLVAALIAFVCLFGAAFGTRSYIGRLAPPPPRSESFGQIWRDGAATLNDRNFFVMVTTRLLTAAASGTSTALWAYMQPYFWGFNSEQTTVILAAQLLSAVIAFALIPLVTVGREKKPVLISLTVLGIVVGSGPVFLYLIGFFPAQGDPTLFYAMVVIGVVQVTIVVMTGVVTASMIADLVESRAVETGRREEGLLFSVLSFIGKVASGFGIWVGGIMLALIEFPTGASTEIVDPAITVRLGWLYGPSLAAFYLLAIAVLSFHQLPRAQHEKNVEILNAS